jgi:hypothetical protein
MRTPLALLVAVAAAFAVSCGRPKLIETACREDSACPTGEICENFQCIPAITRACTNVVSGNPILQPDPYAISFGDLDVSTQEQKLTIHNIGNCTLTLYEASLGKGLASPFVCSLTNATFPMEIFPGRSREFAVSFATDKPGRLQDELKILSDDKQFSELRVPLSVNFLGVPKLQVAPNPVDFGYVAMGRQSSRNVQLSNQGTGVAPITIQTIAFSDPMTMDFAFVTPFVGPVTLKPLTTDMAALIPLELRYTPRSTAKHAMDLLIVTDHGTIKVPLTGNSETPPQLTFNPTMINLGNVPLGATNLAALTLTNMGGAPLVAQLKWGGTNPNTDLFTSPTVIPPIAAGALIDIQVGFTATAIGPVTGLLNLTTNDPSKPSITIPVTANGVMGAGPQVVKLEMVYENGTDSVFDNDVRNVDMTLEHPFGYICNKQTPNPMNWGTYGKPSWLAFAPKEEPERIVLADATTDGTYRVMLQYVESCASIPTGLLAGLLGISTEVLVGYLSGGTIPVNGEDVSKLVAQICLSNKNSNATVRAYVNGTLVKEKTVNLGKRGDSIYAMDLERLNGVFTAK